MLFKVLSHPFCGSWILWDVPGKMQLLDTAAARVCPSSWSLPVWALAILEVKCPCSGLFLVSRVSDSPLSLLKVIFRLHANPN